MFTVKTEEEIGLMRDAGRLASQTLDMIEKHIRPGITTAYIDKLCHDFIIANNAIPAPLMYKGFPNSVCTSVNEVICHGVPDSKKHLKNGDIVGVDVTVILNGYHGDTCRTFTVGKTDSTTNKLVKVAREAMYAGIGAVKVGGKLSDIGDAIQKVADSASFSVVTEFGGHGIGRVFHEEPWIPHYGNSGSNIIIVPGMVFTIEPMVNEGLPYCITDNTPYIVARTMDGKYSAQFEHTIAVHYDGTVEILTKYKNPRCFKPGIL